MNKKIVLLVSVYILLLSGMLVYVQSMPELFYADIAIICDGNPYLSHIEDSLSLMGLSYEIMDYNEDYLYTANIDTLLHYPRVIFYNRDRSITADEHSALTSYLAAGGNLLVTGYDSLGDPSDWRLADIVRSSVYGDNKGEPDLYVRDPTHPIMNGSYGSFPAEYHIERLESDNDRAQAATARGAVTVAELADGNDKIIATQTAGGKVIYWNGMGLDDWSNPNCGNMFKNAILWLYPGYEHDLRAYLDVLGEIQIGWTTEIKATVYNRGLNSETDVKLQILINGSTVKSETIPLLENGTSYKISHSWTPDEGIWNVTAYVLPFAGEQMTANNVESKVARVLFYYASVLLEPDYFTIGRFPESFDVTIRVSNVTDLYAYEVCIKYDPDVVNFTDYRFRPDFVFNYSENVWTGTKPLDGRVVVASLLVGPEKGFSGDGILCHLEFTAIGSGYSCLSMSEVQFLDPEGNAMGAMFSIPSGGVDAKLMANGHIVTVEPSYQVVSWDFSSKPNKMDFDFNVVGGMTHCDISVPLDAMDGPFEIIIDNNFTNKIGYSIEFNVTQKLAFLHFDYDLEEGVHNFKVLYDIDLNDDGTVNIHDLFVIAKNYGQPA